MAERLEYGDLRPRVEKAFKLPDDCLGCAGVIAGSLTQETEQGQLTLPQAENLAGGYGVRIAQQCPSVTTELLGEYERLIQCTLAPVITNS